MAVPQLSTCRAAAAVAACGIVSCGAAEGASKGHAPHACMCARYVLTWGFPAQEEDEFCVPCRKRCHCHSSQAHLVHLAAALLLVLRRRHAGVLQLAAQAAHLLLQVLQAGGVLLVLSLQLFVPVLQLVHGGLQLLHLLVSFGPHASGRLPAGSMDSANANGTRHGCQLEGGMARAAALPDYAADG